MRPTFMSANVQLASAPRIVGTNHIVFSLKQEGCEKIFDCIGFNLGQYYDQIISNNSHLDIVYTIDKATRDGRTFPQLRLKDLQIKENIRETV